MNLFNNLKLSRKFGLSFGIVLSLLVLLGAAGFAGISKLGGRINDFKVDVVPGQEAAAGLRGSTKEAFVALGAITSPFDKHHKVENTARFQQLILGEVKIFDAYDKTITITEDRQNFEEFKKLWDNFVQLSQGFVAKIGAGASDQKLDEEYDAIEKSYAELQLSANRVVEWNSKHGLKVVADSEADIASTKRSMSITLGLAMVIGLFFAVKLTKSITKPILEVSKGLESLGTHCIPSLNQGLQAQASGDLTHSIVPATSPISNPAKDEIGQMAKTFNTMLQEMVSAIGGFNSANENLSKLIGQVGVSSQTVSENSSHIAASSEQISAGASQIAAGSESLATSATEAASIVEEMQAQANEVSQSSEQQASAVSQASGALSEATIGIQKVDEAAKEMSKFATEGGQAVGQTVAAMGLLKSLIETSSSKVMELNTASKEIGDIVKTIDSIAAQTNLLALNAAIEAARAGEHGRGFAVVADEVRKLAEQSSNATKEIALIIQNVRQIVQDASESMTTTAKNAEDGVQKSALAGKALEDILEAVDRVVNFAQEVENVTAEATTAMQNVASSAEYNLSSAREMQIGTLKVARAITEVASVSEESAACAEELSAGIQSVTEAVGELNNLATGLKGQVGQFKVTPNQEDSRVTILKVA